MGSTGHVIAGFLASVVSALLHLAISDGRSVVVVRDESEAALSAKFGPNYGVGVLHDSRGHEWRHLQHAANACPEKRRLGEVAISFAFIALIANALLVLVHLVGAQRGGKVFGLVGVAGHAVSAVALAIVLGAATALYDRTYCGGAVKDHFRLSYGVPFVVAGILVSSLNAVLLVVFGATKDEAGAPAEGEGEGDGEKGAPEEVPEPVNASEPVAA